MSEHPYHGTPEELRDFVHECLHMTAFYSGMAVNYAEAHDDAGLEYSTRKAAAALKSGVTVLGMLKQANAKLLKERLRARAEREGADVALGL
ncbi:hypothetical protein [Methylorubrum extorquens]|uniref:Uncharacterized protein n=1 Tax=Methylorubrum extorquens (strain CM4 / NCIMB 13688) TaxID=440085 RepID=B7KW10_METC4|nr:hypothetical protein [Methylorubrum extorquens]ACK82826.1 hypothetical protein Mchl_1975 [Methylorubrum extorquens CM4]